MASGFVEQPQTCCSAKEADARAAVPLKLADKFDLEYDENGYQEGSEKFGQSADSKSGFSNQLIGVLTWCMQWGSAKPWE